jgi:hypothetical protein
MLQRCAALALVCALSTVSRADAAETIALPARPTKGLNLLVSGMLAPERDRMPFGFLLGGAYEFPVGPDFDLNLGMSFERLGSAEERITLVSVVDATALKAAPTAIFFGAGVGPMFALGNVRPGARIFGGFELFHERAVPVQVAVELIMKVCDDSSLKCPAARERQTWVAGRIGLRF